MSYRSLPIGNLSNTNITFGSGIQSDASFSYVSVNCDPKIVLPRTSVTDPINPSRSNPKRYQGDLDIAGKIAVERDICNFEVANLKVTGTLILTGPAVFKSCVVIEEDGAVCCPLTVRNTEANTGTPAAQANRALCVEGTTRMRLNTGASTADGNPLLLLAANGLVNTNLTSSTRLALDINVNSLTGQAVGHRILKTGSTMTANSRMFFVNASQEHGLAPLNEISLAEINGQRLEDVNAAGDGAVGANGGVPGSIRIASEQSALWVRCVPQSDSTTAEQLTAPVGALFVDGGTVFRGLAPATAGGTPAATVASRGSHGHIHSSQVTPPKVDIAFSDGTGQIDAKPIDFSTDTCGRIEIIDAVAAASNVLAQIIVTYTVPYPLNAPPIVLLTPDQNLAKANEASGAPAIPISLSFTGTPIFGGGGAVVNESIQFVFNIALASTAGTGNTIGSINYHVIGLI